MKPALSLAFALSGALFLTAFAASAQSSRTNGPAPQSAGKQSAGKQAPAPPSPAESFDAFKNIPDRNIFNTRRYAGRTDAPPQTMRRDPVIESFSLLGTLDYPKGSVAFFEGSSASHRKAVKVDESIGDCKVTGIEPNLVRLEAAGKPVELKVGYMLRREDQGEWKMREAERASDYGSSYTSSSSSGFGSSFGSSGGSSFGNSSFNSRGGSSNSSRDSRSGSSSFNSRDPRGGSSSFNSRGGSSSQFGGGDTPADQAARRIREQDRNGDGKISRDEADSRLRPNFDVMDTNRDGQVDAEEYTAYFARQSGGSSRSGGASSFGNPSSSGGTFNSGGNSNSGNADNSGGNPSGSNSSGGAGESDLLKRLMEQRARENR